jgi:hypothetical protein
MSLDGLINNQTVDGGFGDELNPENVEAQFQRLHSLEDTGEPIVLPDETIDDPTPAKVTPPAPVEPTVPEPPTTPPILSDNVTIDGQQYPTALLREFIQFDEFLKKNPAAAQRMKAAFDPNVPLTSQPVVAPAEPLSPPRPQAFQPPDDLDLEDPSTKYLVDNLTELRQQNSQFQEYLQAQQQQTNLAQIESGISSFTSKHISELTPDEVIRVRQVAAQHNLLDGFMSAGHPISVATEMALDYAMWNIPEIRNKLTEAKAIDQAQQDAATDQAAKEDAARKRRLSALGGSSGNSSRLPAPTMEATGKQGFANAIKEALSASQ